MSDFVTRFAPSPSGLLHKGHAYSALYAFAAAQKAGGCFILRIEDIDTTRCRAPFERAIIEDLHWLGLRWEEPVRRQSDHFDDYKCALKKLENLGVLYRCFLTRREVLSEIVRAPHGVGEVYQGPDTPMSQNEEAKWLARGEAYAWRLSLRAARDVLGPRWAQLQFIEDGTGPNGEHGKIHAQPQRLGDVVLARKDIGTSYHLAVTHDDALQGITHIIRGQDLFESTHIHVLIQALLDMPTPTYRHHRLLLDETGKRLAKRDFASTLQDFRQSGQSAVALQESLRSL
ncbi:MAG: tRNA glutamyl-Q(34) synthetase GluQRS [Robiginitomaculum sp.]|nr:MAG: tRNA glutamyl-Q(34) synthetase GluQRS [Robiginitomaculum sp.]